MSKWLTRALASLEHDPPVPLVPIAPIAPKKAANGTNGTIGTGGPCFQDGSVGDWQRAFSGLDRDRAPCPLFRNWPGVCRTVEHFLMAHGRDAVALGWGTLELFGVDPLVGTIRLDCSGALMVSNGRPVETITADEITFVNGLVFRRMPLAPGCRPVPVWEFGA